MHPFALLLAFTTRLLSILRDEAQAGEGVGRQWITDPLNTEPTVWDKVATWLGWIPQRARRAPAYARRMPPGTPSPPGSWSRFGH